MVHLSNAPLDKGSAGGAFGSASRALTEVVELADPYAPQERVHSSRVVVTTPPTRSKPSGVWLTSMYGLGAPVLRAWVRVAKAAGVVWSTAPLGSLLSVSLMPEASAATFYASPSPQYEDFCDAGVVMVGPFTVGGQSCG